MLASGLAQADDAQCGGSSEADDDDDDVFVKGPARDEGQAFPSGALLALLRGWVVQGVSGTCQGYIGALLDAGGANLGLPGTRMTSMPHLSMSKSFGCMYIAGKGAPSCAPTDASKRAPTMTRIAAVPSLSCSLMSS